MMTISEHRAACLLNFSTWITVCIAGLGIACNIYRLFEHGMGKLNIWASLLLAGYFFYNGLLILKRNDDGRKNVIFACYLSVGILLFAMGVTFYQTGTFFPNSAGKIHMAAFFFPLGWNLWMLLLLHHPAVKRCFFPELELPEKWKPYNQAENLFLSDGYFLDFCKIAKYDHYANGKTTRPDAVCPGCHLPLTRHLHLDLTAPELARLRVPPNRKSLDFYYCMRCAILESDFQYRIDPETDAILITEYNQEATPATAEEYLDEWLETFGNDELPLGNPFELRPIPVEEADVEPVPNGDYSGPNQIGGELELIQNIGVMTCAYCRKHRGVIREMSYIVTMANQKRFSFKTTYDGVQLVFAFCPECGSIGVTHSCD